MIVCSHRENQYKEHQVAKQTSLTLQWGFLHQHLILEKVLSSLNSCSPLSLFSLQAGYEAAQNSLEHLTLWVETNSSGRGVNMAKEREHMARCREECCTKPAWHLVGDCMIMELCWHCVTSSCSLRACPVSFNWGEEKTKMLVLPVNISHNSGNS